jgi:hypothetical protein
MISSIFTDSFSDDSEIGSQWPQMTTQNPRMMVFKNGEIAAMKDAVAQWANGDM